MVEEIDLTNIKNAFEELYSIKKYKDQINQLLSDYPRKRSLEIDYRDVEKYDPSLADLLINEPDSVIKAAEEKIQEMEFALPTEMKFAPHVRFYNLPGSDMLIEQIDSKMINKLITFKGIITRRAEVMHRVSVAVYKCQACDEIIRFHVTREFAPPTKCPICKKGNLVQIIDESKFVDLQRAEIQDLLERVRGGTPAAKLHIVMEDDIVNSIVPGENVEITGILRLMPPLKTTGKRELIFSRYLDTVHIKRMKRDFEEVEISKEDEKKILELASMPDIEERIVASIAPDIYGHTEIKKGIALQLFGGTKNKVTQSGASIRDDIHILLVGDPGIAKTRFLLQVDKIAPKSIYVSGKSVSGVGLTASAEKDELGEGGWTLKAGALVLASGGLAAIDEFDKINEDDRAALHEVMESQTVSIAKAGIVARFKAKTAIIAAANPRFGRFQQTKNIPEQFDVPPSLLSRFDLIFPIKDVLDTKEDEKLASHILKLHMGSMHVEEMPKPPIDTELLRKYIAYARRNIRPKLTQEAVDLIKEFYVELRGMGQKSGSVAITPRYLEGLVRLSEAHAKMRLSSNVEKRDAEAAINLMRYMMEQTMMDRETGKLDVDIISTGKSRSEREKAITVMDIIKELNSKFDDVGIELIYEEAERYEIDKYEVDRIIEELDRKGVIYYPKQGYVRLSERG
ncbi:MAG: minichromosome maintenance protein MCM [Candidatus Anstonellales archaeon]